MLVEGGDADVHDRPADHLEPRIGLDRRDRSADVAGEVEVARAQAVHARATSGTSTKRIRLIGGRPPQYSSNASITSSASGL